MAIAGIVISAAQARLSEVRELVRAMPGVLDVQVADDASRLAVVLESSSRTLQKDLESLRDLPHVLEVEVAYANYEDDLDSEGHMACPPREPRSRKADPEREGSA